MEEPNLHKPARIAGIPKEATWVAFLWWPWSLLREIVKRLGLHNLLLDPIIKRSCKKTMSMSYWGRGWEPACEHRCCRENVLVWGLICRMQGADSQVLHVLSSSTEEADITRLALWHLRIIITENWGRLDKWSQPLRRTSNSSSYSHRWWQWLQQQKEPTCRRQSTGRLASWLGWSGSLHEDLA